MSEEFLQRIRRRLRVIRWDGILDLILLIVLVTASLADNRELVRVFGPLHGGNYLLLLTLAGVGAVDGLWRWWFPVAVLLTGGPPGALIGEWRIAQQIEHASAAHTQQENHV